MRSGGFAVGTTHFFRFRGFLARGLFEWPVDFLAAATFLTGTDSPDRPGLWGTGFLAVAGTSTPRGGHLRGCFSASLSRPIFCSKIARARGPLGTPRPARSGDIPGASSHDSMMASIISCPLADDFAWNNKAARPAMIGVAIEVPTTWRTLPRECMRECPHRVRPGPVQSGFSDR